MKPVRSPLPQHSSGQSACPHMRGLLSSLSDGTLKHGILRWYTIKHSELCPCCRQALESLRLIGAELDVMRARRTDARLSSTDWATIEAAWDETDKQA